MKEVLEWMIDTEAGTVALQEQKLQELNQLVAIPATERRIGRKEMERLVGKVCSMHLTVPEAVAHLYHIQRDLVHGGVDRVWLLSEFHQEIDDWKTLVAQTVAWTTHLAEIFRREPTHLGFCNTSGIGTGGVWLDPSRSQSIIVWRHP